MLGNRKIWLGFKIERGFMMLGVGDLVFNRFYRF